MFLYFKHIFNGLGSWFSSHGQLKVLIWESSEERWGPLESVAEVLFCLKMIIIIITIITMTIDHHDHHDHHNTSITTMSPASS